MDVFVQTWTLTRKNVLIVLGRHSFATVVRAFLLPILLTSFLSFARNLFVPPAIYGIASPHAVRSLASALNAAGGTGRDTVVFVDNGFTGGDIGRVITGLSKAVTDAGWRPVVLRSENQLPAICRATLRGVTPCFGAVVFASSPTEGAGAMWNYTLRADGALGAGRVNINRDDNDSELYMLPLQKAVDAAISANSSTPLGQTDEYPFTSLTQEERDDRVRVLYQSAIMNFLGVTFIAGMIGIVYHMTGFIATERESGMSTLLDAMMVVKHRWQAQASRLWSYHVAFSVLYLPGWLIGSLILWRGVFAHTSFLVVLLYHILAGLALASMSIFGASFFKKSQLSGVSITIIYLILAILAQSLTAPKTGAVAILSLLFAPCNYTFFISLLARWEQKQLPTNLTKTPPDSPWNLSGIALWVFLIIQIIVYPILGALLERYFHGTTSSTRNIVVGDNRGGLEPETAVQLDDFTKIYKPSIFRRLFSFVAKPKEPVVAVNKLTLRAGRGQILALLGANGSGKSTTLDSIAGINKLTSGKITIDGTGGLGIAPQKNVFWDELTVEEHVLVFNRLKTPRNRATKQQIRELIVSIDLEQKIKAQSKTLSGGQKRKLQLGMMLTGGSAVCCVDEVSSGLDPLSRRKIWDILLAERGRRTIIMTTHFLDEADLLADHIAIMSKGNLRAEGTSVELKNTLGGGYRIHVNNVEDFKSLPDVEGVTKRVTFEEAVYVASSSSLAAKVIKDLETAGITDYRFSGPTIEDVFLQLADEIQAEGGFGSGLDEKQAPYKKETSSDEGGAGNAGFELLSGRRIGYLRQTWVLFLKRCTIFKHNFFPPVAAFAIPVIAAGLVTLYVKGQGAVGCDPAAQVTRNIPTNIFAPDFSIGGLQLSLVGGPRDKFTQETLIQLFLPIYAHSGGGSGSGAVTSTVNTRAASPIDFLQNVTIVDSLTEFNNYVAQQRKNIVPAGIWLGDANSRPTLAFKANGAEMFSAWFGQYAMNMLLTNTSFASSYVSFDSPFSPDTGKALQMLVYVVLALCAYPAFFSLYPNLERRRQVRGLQYSNGVRPLPLWLAYLAFDFAIAVTASILVIALFVGLAPNVWYNVGYVFLVLVLYGLASTLLSYNVSLFSNNQLSSYAFTAGGQVVLFLVYLIAYLSTMTYAPISKIDSYLLIVHFVIAAFAPIGSAARTMFLALNLFSTACEGEQLAPNPGGILQYGGPVLYLILQSIFLFALLIWFDGGNDEEVATEMARVKTNTSGADGRSADGLRVVSLTKSFGSNTAVDNVTFGIQHGEVFALLGPNGAGKSTTISVVRGDIKPTGGVSRGGDVFVEDVSVTRHLAQARSHLGVCPQFDAIDSMTVTEHLRFYARVRGISDIEHNVAAVLAGVGLSAFRDRQAHDLSGGNKRKLSLGIALMGNPTVLLLDEPSSGLDAAAKRVMWRTLAATVPGRSILLTTHSMEEADALAGRAGILAKRMLAMGSIERLRSRFGEALHVHLVCRGAPRTTPEHVQRVRDWVLATFLGAVVDDNTYHGQMRFSVPIATAAAAATAATAKSPSSENGNDNQNDDYSISPSVATATAAAGSSDGSAIGKLVVLLEENRDALGIEHYSVSPTTLDQVFLTVVGRHNVREEGYEQQLLQQQQKKAWWKFGRR
ncbi:hypothetical protein B0T26DRAFT_652353 [Lasiosphaeria miniovina]|uniref:ABC transporter domain-containing protein n=1 Tax=Lasiosphaeria miniovina TaxID=1954250 RepID=A0AA40A541_9PEZI|nr:uncharacterized protein B0T26DRAFT_652353 [Lasiosphaeria miniovina]KAK0709437.1 hypothetical protein B0T26DRAFT_652353 [Lasiosphaeria miniovina]